MPLVRAHLLRNNQTLSVLRMDGDMYESTIDQLYHLYDLVDVGGYIIIDDFGWKEGVTWGAREAILDFRELHGIEADGDSPIIIVDFGIAYFVKKRATKVQFERYGTMAVRANVTYHMSSLFRFWKSQQRMQRK